MELTKEQILHIENRLEKNGIKYWDIKIEILDHIVSDIEKRLTIGELYKSALENSFYALGFHGDLTGLNKRRLLGINKIVRKQYFTNIKSLLTNSLSAVTIFSFIVIYYLFFSLVSVTVFKISALILLITPITVGAILHFSEFLKKRKSGYLTYSSFYIFFAFLLLNMFIQFVKPGGIIPVSKEVQLWVWFLVTAANSVFSYAGIQVYLKTKRKIKNSAFKLKNL
ncbi:MULTISPECIES: hypothetical protein [unclassified Polaribacter]|uniref:hypothetical protein n=1 Tax=unclassified Polaribacter TaxID=196858 RepID=UPI0011BD658F|nr:MULTISPECIES: hypothetical protein [unclassified Polaribacter]TXD50594.1 hypothetical protein ES043_15485 [Polaribacter sp. IC063]TXD61718.1 hypothetical protein ES044_04320 [Polaribacter sp. IC066]